MLSERIVSANMLLNIPMGTCSLAPGSSLENLLMLRLEEPLAKSNTCCLHNASLIGALKEENPSKEAA